MHDESHAKDAEGYASSKEKEQSYRYLPKSDESMSDKTELVALIRSSGWKIAAQKAEELFRQMMRIDTIDTKFSSEEVKIEVKAREKAREFISDWFESIFNTAFEPDILTEEEKDVFVRVSEN